MTTPNHRENDRQRRLREDAKAAGKLTFNTGRHCKYGHTADRYVTGGGCIQCAKDRCERNFNGKLIPPRPALGSHCPICDHIVSGKSHKREERKWVRDHDHDTEEFRGWICNICNNGLGSFNDDPELLQKAASYLSKKDL
jgi:hypothetical protein